MQYLAGTAVHCLHFMGSLQASHGMMSSIMENVEEIYSMIHADEKNLYPYSAAQEKTPETNLYFTKIATFRTIDHLRTEECFYHVNSRGMVTEVKEELGLYDGYKPATHTDEQPESPEDYSWYYGSLHREESHGQQRLFVSLAHIIK
jgi:hypothetical protein